MITPLVLTKSDIPDTYLQVAMERPMDTAIWKSEYASSHVHVHRRLQFGHRLYFDRKMMHDAFVQLFENFKNIF